MTAVHALEELLPNHELAGENIAVGLGGLRSADGRAFPLKRVTARTSIAGPCARTVVDQHFANGFDETLDVTWIFPLPSDGAIVALELRAGDIVVIGECQKRSEAQTTFAAARAEGKRAALLETEQRGVHTLSLAGLPPGSDVHVRVTIMELLQSSDARFRWQFPTSIAPRYTPGTEVSHDGFGVTPDTDAVPNASRLTPPIRLAGGTVLDLEVEFASPLSILECSLHAVKFSSLDDGRVRVAPRGISTLNRDFILEFATNSLSTVENRAYTDGQYIVAIVQPPLDASPAMLPRDAVFVVDISGSMEGAKLDAAKAALMGALHGLEHHDRFSLLAFDDRVERFRTDFVEYNDVNVRAADQWIAALQSRGGTEMLEAIRESLSGDTPHGRVRTVLFITDGQSNDEARLLPAVSNRRGNAVFFTLGIDTAVNESLLKQLARAGGGVCELCTPTDDIDAVVAKLETRFGSPILTNVRATGSARPDGQTVFAGRPVSIFIEGSPHFVEISADLPRGVIENRISPVHIDFPLGALWARERVSYLEERLLIKPFEEEAIKPEIERIALEHKIASKFTSFVCVDHSSRSHGERRHVVQPVEFPHQWEEAAFGSGAPLAMPSPVMYSPPPLQARHAPLLSRKMISHVEESAEAFESAMDSMDSLRAAPGHYMQDIQAMQDIVSTGEYPAANAFVESLPPEETANASSFRSMFNRVLGSSKKEQQRDQSPASATSSPESVMARTQNANGSYGDDVGRSAAALVALVVLGNTRKKGNRRRTVKKLAAWLELHRADARATVALHALREAETGTVLSRNGWTQLVGEGAEGAILSALL